MLNFVSKKNHINKCIYLRKMKILYAIQGTGNGHVSRAREVIPILQQYGDVDLLISGTQADVGLPYPVKYQLNGFGFVFGKKGGVDFRETWNRFNTKAFISDIKNLPLHEYDAIINDFEPVTAWACKRKRIKSVALSHQSSFLSDKTPVTEGFHWGKLILKNYAPTTYKIGFHFEKYDDFIHTPVIRNEIRNLHPQDKGHYTIYLPAYNDDFIINRLQKYKDKEWHIFSKHSSQAYEKENIKVTPVNNELFNKSLETCNGLLTGGGFEGPAEALYLGKKLLSVPMRNQFEQQCNALAMEKMGVPVIWKTADWERKLNEWIFDSDVIKVSYPDETKNIVRNMFERYFN